MPLEHGILHIKIRLYHQNLDAFVEKCSRPSSVEGCDLKTVKMVVDLSDLLHSDD